MEQKQLQEFAPMKESRERSSTVKNVEQYEETPFSIIEIEDGDRGEDTHFIGIGNKRLTPLMTKEECERMIDEKDWTLITQLAMHIMEHQETIKTINEAYRQGGLTKKQD